MESFSKYINADLEVVAAVTNPKGKVYRIVKLKSGFYAIFDEDGYREQGCIYSKPENAFKGIMALDHTARFVSTRWSK
jgi:hypothetical protein